MFLFRTAILKLFENILNISSRLMLSCQSLVSIFIVPAPGTDEHCTNDYCPYREEVGQKDLGVGDCHELRLLHDPDTYSEFGGRHLPTEKNHA